MNRLETVAARVIRRYTVDELPDEMSKKVHRWLGVVPVDPWGNRAFNHWFCKECDTYVEADLMCWGDYDGAPDAPRIKCINCKLEQENENG